MKKWHLPALLAALVVLLIGSYGFTSQKSSHWVNSTTPTIFIHGYGSSYHAEETMVMRARRSNITSTVVLARVDNDGNVKLSGPSIKGKRNPIVEVNLENNRQTDMNEGARYINNVIQALQKRDGIKSYNLVAHSMGNMDAFSYVARYGTQPGAPVLKKQVVLAGGGLTGWSRQGGTLPASITGNLGQLKDTYPHAKVLNIAGDKGDGSDGRFPNAASKSVKDMLGDRPKSYQFVMYKGKTYTHSNLHENQKVSNRINNFLWGK